MIITYPNDVKIDKRGIIVLAMNYNEYQEFRAYVEGSGSEFKELAKKAVKTLQEEMKWGGVNSKL